jgi:hypothetical protein
MLDTTRICEFLAVSAAYLELSPDSGSLAGFRRRASAYAEWDDIQAVCDMRLLRGDSIDEQR